MKTLTIIVLLAAVLTGCGGGASDSDVRAAIDESLETSFSETSASEMEDVCFAYFFMGPEGYRGMLRDALASRDVEDDTAMTEGPFTGIAPSDITDEQVDYVIDRVAALTFDACGEEG